MLSFSAAIVTTSATEAGGLVNTIGKQNADPFISFLRSIYWPDRLPTVSEAVTSAYWTVRFVSELGTSGVGLGINAIVLESGQDSTVARPVDDKKLLEIDEFIDAAKLALADMPKGGSAETTNTAPSAAEEIPTLEES